jgi:hypothetical protein
MASAVRNVWPETLTDRSNEISGTWGTSGSGSEFSDREISSPRPNVKVTLKAQTGDSVRTIELVLKVSQVPRWLKPTLERAASLLLLPFSWDNDGAQSIGQMSIQLAVNSLLKFMSEFSALPQWTPSRSGGVQLDWHESAIDLEIIFEPFEADCGYARLSDQQTGDFWEGRVDRRLDDLRAVLANRLVR